MVALFTQLHNVVTDSYGSFFSKGFHGNIDGNVQGAKEDAVAFHTMEDPRAAEA